MRIGWLLGWAVPETWFRPFATAAWPEAEHAFFAAVPGAARRLRAAGPFDWTVGYSLGALLLLLDPVPVQGPVALLAPIFAFPAEEGLGGKVSRGQVRQLARWLPRDPRAAREDFYRRSGLDVGEGDTPPVPDLIWGLERLANDRAEPFLPRGWRGWCGAGDPLLDAGRLRERVPAVAVVPEATHHPAALIAAFARHAGEGGAP